MFGTHHAPKRERLSGLPGQAPAARKSRRPYRSGGVEPALSEMMADPIVIRLMESDRVAEADIRALIDAARTGAYSPQGTSR